MNLYLLTYYSESVQLYDIMTECVVRAKSSKEARVIAQANGSHETDDEATPWLDPSQSKCQVIKTEGGSELILASIFNG